MTYNEWRDELKDNLLSVTEEERKRVLDFYAEAYADKREAGKSEREIINDFGAPYDAAQRILEGEKESVHESLPQKEEKADDLMFSPSAEEKSKKAKKEKAAPPPSSQPADMTWLFVILCIVFAVPLFLVVLFLSLATFFICLAPIIAIGSGAALIGASIGSFFGGVGLSYSFYVLGCGIAVLGAGIAFCPLFFRLSKFFWKVFKNLFTRIRLFFKGRAA